jgi:hypothetical protein
MPLALTSDQLLRVMTIAADLSVEKRDLLLQRLAARLQLLGRFTSAESLTGLTAR